MKTFFQIDFITSKKKVHPNSFTSFIPPWVDVEYTGVLLKEGYSEDSIKLKILPERMIWSDVLNKDEYLDKVIRSAKEILSNPSSNFNFG